MDMKLQVAAVHQRQDHTQRIFSFVCVRQTNLKNINKGVTYDWSFDSRTNKIEKLKKHIAKGQTAILLLNLLDVRHENILRCFREFTIRASKYTTYFKCLTRWLYEAGWPGLTHILKLTWVEERR